MTNGVLMAVVDNLDRAQDILAKETKNKRVDPRIIRDALLVVDKVLRAREAAPVTPTTKLPRPNAQSLALAHFVPSSQLNHLNKRTAMNADFSVGPRIDFAISSGGQFYVGGLTSAHTKQFQQITKPLALKHHLIYLSDHHVASHSSHPKRTQVSGLEEEAGDSGDQIDLRVTDADLQQKHRREQQEGRDALLNSIRHLNISKDLKERFLSGLK